MKSTEDEGNKRHARKVCSDAIPHGTVPGGLGSVRRALVVVRLIGVDPYCVGRAVEQRLERVVVGVASVVSRRDDFVAREPFFSVAAVLNKGKAVLRRSPAHNVDDFDPLETAPRPKGGDRRSL